MRSRSYALKTHSSNAATQFFNLPTGNAKWRMHFYQSKKTLPVSRHNIQLRRNSSIAHLLTKVNKIINYFCHFYTT